MPVVRKHAVPVTRPAEAQKQTGILSTQTGVLNASTGTLRGTGNIAVSGTRTAGETNISQLRQRVHSRIISELRDSVDLSDDLGVRREIERLFARYMADEDIILSRTERTKLQNQVIAEIL